VIEAELLQNRELSWLDFEERVLHLAADPATPPLERAKFLAIFSQNLDEFFQVRVAGLKEKVDAGLRKPSFDGLTPAAQLAAIGERVAGLIARADAVFLEDLIPTLAAAGIRFSSWTDLDADDQAVLTEMFEREVYPVLTPLAVDPAHPFPYISNLSLNLAVVVIDPVDGERRFARVKVPSLLPRFVVLPDGERFVSLEQVIAAHLDRLFPGMVVDGHMAFRVTRNADLDVEEEEAADLLAAIELEVRRRRFGRAVRLEIVAGMDDEVRSLLQRELGLGDQDTFVQSGPLDLGGLWRLHDLDRPDLTYPEFVPVTQRGLRQEEGAPVDLFAHLDRRDVLVHHPYDSFATSVEELIVQASADPAVLAVKITLYRTSGDSPIVGALIRAAEAGKQVVALVELKARFDEENNIEWARRLEQAGVHVVYGLVGLKTHCKVTLVARRDAAGEVRRYCHIGTGNYNSRTARTYEDLGLLTADPSIGADAGELFNALTGFARDVKFGSLLVAPDDLRPRLIELIREERGHPDGDIVMKMNSLVDPDLIEELYAAAGDGVRVRMIVRGICCLRPGVPGLSEGISVRSLVGRYLEHSRVYRFGHGGEQGGGRCYIGSADLMPRNLDRRVEVLVPIHDPDLRRRIDDVLDLELADDVLAWELVDRTWTKVPTSKGIDTHLELQERVRLVAEVAAPGEGRVEGRELRR
jgi:polyphosphate kinase